MKIETILTPAELPALAQRDLRATACVVFDVLRATSTFVTALHHGAKAIIPVSEIAEALEIKKSEARSQKPGLILLGGERNGVRISADGIDFDLGNSPREYTPEKVRGKTIVSTTTNGTRALRAVANAKMVLAGSFLNLTATAEFLWRENFENVLLICAGTGENQADEDVLAAGALCELLTARADARPTKKCFLNYLIPRKSRDGIGWRQNRICRRRSAIQQTQSICWRFPNCATTWRSVCSGIFFRSSPRWKRMARFADYKSFRTGFAGFNSGHLENPVNPV